MSLPPTASPIVFRTSIGATTGLGHASRVRTLALACADEDIPCIVVLDDSDGLHRVFDWTGIDLRVVADDVSWTSTVPEPARVLVTDLPGLDAATAAMARDAGFTTLVHLCIDGADRYPADLLCNASPGPLPWAPIARRQVRGPRFAVVHPDIQAARPGAPRTSSPVGRALVAMGGSDPADNSITVAGALRERGIETTVLAGPGVAPSRLGDWERSGTDCIRVDRPSEFASLLLGYDMLVTQGGLMAYEGMFLGIPVACVDRGAQPWFSRNLANAGLASLVTVTLEDPLPSPDHLAATARRAFDTIDGRGAQRTLAEISMEGAS